MIHTIVIGDEKFYADAGRTILRVPYLMLNAIDDMTGSIARLARAFAPGSLDRSVGVTPAHKAGTNFKGEVGVRNIPPHTKFVYHGTGIYGPLHRPYVINKTQTNFGPDWGIDRTGRPNPAVGNVMKIPDHAGGHYFRRQVTVMGQKPQPFLTEAFELLRHTEVPLRVQRIAREIVHGGVG